MMKKRSTFILTLCVALIFALSTGCGGFSNKNSSPPAAVNDAEETVHLVVERPLWGNGDPSSEYAKRIREKIREELNIDVEIVGQSNPADQNELPSLMLAAGEQLDIFQVTPSDIRGWRKFKADDLIYPLSDLLDKYGQNLKASLDPLSWPFITDSDGIVWALPDEAPPVTLCLYVRQDWLDELSMDIPVTWEEFENMMQTFQDDLGDVGFVPTMLSGDDTAVVGGAERIMFLGSFVDHLDNYIDDAGNMQPLWVQPGFKDFLSKMADWYKKGYLNREIITMDYGSAAELMAGGVSGLMFDWIGAYGIVTNINEIKPSVPEVKLSPLAPPTGPQRGKVLADSPVSMHIMISKSSKNPEAAMKFIDWSMATDEGWALCKYGIEGIDWEYVDRANGLISQIGEPNYAIYCSTRLNSFAGKLLTDLAAVDAHNFYQNDKTYPRYITQTFGFVWDFDAIKPFADQLLGLDVELRETYAGIVMGERPVGDWDGMIDKYMNGGGRAYFDELTRQFK